jgi:Tfp pilus assembly protein PilX
MTQHLLTRTPLRHAAARGISLIFSLITLAALSLAAVALIRSVDTGATILGNLSFKQDTILAADEASRQALVWLNTQNTQNPAALRQDDSANGYFASLAQNLDPTGTSTDVNRTVIDWTGGTVCKAATQQGVAFKGGCLHSGEVTAQAGGAAGLPSGVSARYLIMRLCSAAGDANTVSCARPLQESTAAAIDRNALRSGAGKRLSGTSSGQYFRVLVRAQGARNTVTYTETLVHF